VNQSVRACGQSATDLAVDTGNDHSQAWSRVGSYVGRARYSFADAFTRNVLARSCASSWLAKRMAWSARGDHSSCPPRRLPGGQR
jgi:hypothetical protein